MSTTALICVKKTNGRYSCTPVHFDGYIEGGVGETLEKYWVNPKDIFDLCESYDGIRTLGETYQDTEFFDDDDTDYIESLKDIDTNTYLEKQENYNYVYVYDEATSQWLNFGRRGLIPLSKLIKESIQKKSFEEMCKKIISESKSKTQKVVDGSKDKPDIIAEKDIDVEQNATELQNKPASELTEQEKEFLAKFLEYAKLNTFTDTFWNKMIKSYTNVLGKNNSLAISDCIEQEVEKTKQAREQLKSELINLRNQIKAEEESKANEANRKLSLISILDKNVINESIELKQEDIDDNVRIIDTGLPATKENDEIISSVFGQLSDGIWENSPRMNGYWMFATNKKYNGKVVLVVDKTPGSWLGSNSPKALGHRYLYPNVNNPYLHMSDEKIIAWFANKIKYIVKLELGDSHFAANEWNRTNTHQLDYLGGYKDKVTISDAYKAYDIMKGRHISEDKYISLDEK